jgi:large subunit ribosomal protein L28
MARSDISGRRRLRGNLVSHSNIKTPHWQLVNVQRRRIWVPELKKFIALKVTTRDLRTIDRLGLMTYARRFGLRLS